MSRPASVPPDKTISYRLVNWGTFAVYGAWLVFACYALAHLVSR